jgi:hypothetical protein
MSILRWSTACLTRHRVEVKKRCLARVVPAAGILLHYLPVRGVAEIFCTSCRRGVAGTRLTQGAMAGLRRAQDGKGHGRYVASPAA